MSKSQSRLNWRQRFRENDDFHQIQIVLTKRVHRMLMIAFAIGLVLL